MAYNTKVEPKDLESLDSTTIADGDKLYIYDVSTGMVKVITKTEFDKVLLQLGETSTTAYRGNRGKTAYDHSQSTHAPLDEDYVVETAHADLTGESVLGTSVITTNTLAARQAAAKAGRIFLPSNSFYLQRDTGTAWETWGLIFPMTPPVLSDFTWVNQGTATTDTTYGSIYITALASASNSLKILKKSKTGTYSVIAFFIPHIINFVTGYLQCGLLWRQSSDGKLVTFHYSPSESALLVQKWTNQTTFSASYATALSVTNRPPAGFWLKITVDSTNRICSYSLDGQYWLALHTVSKTDFLTADEVGFFVNTSTSSYNSSMNLLSWKEA